MGAGGDDERLARGDVRRGQDSCRSPHAEGRQGRRAVVHGQVPTDEGDVIPLAGILHPTQRFPGQLGSADDGVDNRQRE